MFLVISTYFLIISKIGGYLVDIKVMSEQKVIKSEVQEKFKHSIAIGNNPKKDKQIKKILRDNLTLMIDKMMIII